MKKLVSKHEKHRKTQVTTESGLQLYDGNMKIDVPTSPRGVAKTKHRPQVAKVAGASKRNCGPTRRDYCKNQCVQKIWPV